MVKSAESKLKVGRKDDLKKSTPDPFGRDPNRSRVLWRLLASRQTVIRISALFGRLSRRDILCLGADLGCRQEVWCEVT